jgi:hypothetical protein
MVSPKKASEPEPRKPITKRMKTGGNGRLYGFVSRSGKDVQKYQSKKHRHDQRRPKPKAGTPPLKGNMPLFMDLESAAAGTLNH